MDFPFPTRLISGVLTRRLTEISEALHQNMNWSSTLITEFRQAIVWPDSEEYRWGGSSRLCRHVSVLPDSGPFSREFCGGRGGHTHPISDWAQIRICVSSKLNPEGFPFFIFFGFLVDPSAVKGDWGSSAVSQSRMFPIPILAISRATQIHPQSSFSPWDVSVYVEHPVFPHHRYFFFRTDTWHRGSENSSGCQRDFLPKLKVWVRVRGKNIIFYVYFRQHVKDFYVLKYSYRRRRSGRKRKKRADKISGKTVWVFSWARSGIMRDAVREESKRAFFWFGGFGFLFDWIWWCLFIIFGWRCGLGVDQEKYTQMIYGWR